MSLDLRRYLNIILENMNRAEALAVFSQAGIDASGLSGKTLRAARNRLAQAQHPDAGGSDDTMKAINAAYDALKDGAGHSSKRGAATKPFTAASFVDDDAPNEVEDIRVDCFPIDNPTIVVNWYSWSRRINRAEAEQVLALKPGGTLDVDEWDRPSPVGYPPHRAQITRRGDQIVYRFTHFAHRGPDQPVTADLGYITYGVSVADLSREYQELKKAPARAADIIARNRLASQTGAPYISR